MPHPSSSPARPSAHARGCVRVRVQTQDFDVAAELLALRQADARVGAVCSFLGTVREAYGTGAAHPLVQGDAPTGPESLELELELEHYPGMTERAIEAMIDAAHQRFDIIRAHVIHRVGRLALTEQIVWVGVTAAHRGQSFAACEFLMDYLKTQAPFWKKEHTAQGAHWVDARSSDDAALARWGVHAPSNAQPAAPAKTLCKPAKQLGSDPY